VQEGARAPGEFVKFGLKDAVHTVVRRTEERVHARGCTALICHLSPPFKAEETSSVATLNSFCFMAHTICARIAEFDTAEGDTMVDIASGVMSCRYLASLLQYFTARTRCYNI
jgi:hypothetical protein